MNTRTPTLILLGLFLLAGTALLRADISAVNSTAEERDPWPSPDGYTLYFASNRDAGDFDLYESHWSGLEWSDPVRLPAPINSDFDETQPSMSADGRFLAFVSMRGRFWRGTWVCTRLRDGTWSPPVFVDHPTIPLMSEARITADGQAVVFRTDPGRPLQITRRDRTGTWRAPRPFDGPLPEPVGTSGRWDFSVANGDILSSPLPAEQAPLPTEDHRETVNAVRASSTYGNDDEYRWISEVQNLVDGFTDTGWVSASGADVHRQWVLLALNGHARYRPGLSRVTRVRVHPGPTPRVRHEYEHGQGRDWYVPTEPTTGTSPAVVRILGGWDPGQLSLLATADLRESAEDSESFRDIGLPTPAWVRYIRIEIQVTESPDAPFVSLNEVEIHGAGLSAPFPSPRVTTDDHNNILVDNEPFFPLYIYNSKADSRQRRWGFNTAIQTYDVAPDMTRLAILDQALDDGYRVLAHVPFIDSEPERLRARNQIAALRHHPALLGYLLSDEAGHSTEIMARDQRRAEFIRAHDPDHFTMLNDLYPQYYPRSSAFVDVFSIDPYPHIVGQPYSYQGDAVDAAYAAVQGRKPVLVVNASWGPIVSPVENRLNVYLALIHGAKGISWYAKEVYDTHPDHWSSILRCVDEIHRLQPVLSAPAAPADSPLWTQSRIDNPNTRVDVMLREVSGEVWMLAANCEPRPAEVRFSFGWGDNIVVREIMADHPLVWSLDRNDFHRMDAWPPGPDREPVSRARPIRVPFAPYAVRVFRMRPAAPPAPLHDPVGGGRTMATANPALQTLVAERAKALRDQGDHEGAKAEIDGFWSAYADRVSVDDLAALTEILADSEADADSVVADYGRLADEHPEAESWAYWVYRVVAALMREERRDEAEAWLDRLVDRRPQDLWRANAEVLVRPASVRNNIKPWTVAQGLDTPVRIDAVLDEPVWADRVTFRETVFLDDSKQPQNTEFAVARDSEALYLAVRALEPTPDAMVTRVDKPDRGVWSDDCIVIYLDPELDYKDYIQFIFNSAGTKWDGVADNRGQCSAAKLDAEVERRTVVGTDAWTLEVRIPFRELGIEAPSPGEVWGLGLQRWRHATGTLHTVWGNRRGTSHDNRPERFGFLQFAP